MNQEIKMVIDAFKKRLKQEFIDRLCQVIIFGSCADETASAMSDIDVAVILNGTIDWHTRQKIYDMAFEAEGDSGRVLNVTVFSRDEFESRSIESLLLVEEIKTQGIPV